MTILDQDINIANLIRDESLKYSEIQIEDKFYKEFIESIAIPKMWEDKDLRSSSDTEFFTYKAKKYSDEKGYLSTLITYTENDLLCYALLYRGYLIDLNHDVDFYQDVKLGYYLQSVSPKLSSPWKYV